VHRLCATYVLTLFTFRLNPNKLLHAEQQAQSNKSMRVYLLCVYDRFPVYSVATQRDVVSLFKYFVCVIIIIVVIT